MPRPGDGTHPRDSSEWLRSRGLVELRAPTSVLAYAGLNFVYFGMAAIQTPKDGYVYFTIAALALLIVGLWRRSRAAWIVLLILEALAIVSTPFFALPWWDVVVAAVGLVLLLSAPTRRHLSRAEV